MLIIGLTGGIASGKSTIARALAEEPGIAVIDADRLAWETYRPGTATYRALVEHFGDEILNSDPHETINRRKLAEIVFRDAKEREFLNSVVHPAIMSQLIERAREQEKRGTEILVVEAALLLEARHVDRSFFDRYIVVRVDPEEQIRRLMERDRVSRDQALARIGTQRPQSEKVERADHVIDSHGDPGETIRRTKELLHRLKRQTDKSP